MDHTASAPGSVPAQRVSSWGVLDRPARWVTERSTQWRGPLADVMRGRPLGHRLHPSLTDLPIGFWTSAFVLDVLGGKRRADAAQRLVGLGVLSALPTALAGFADVPSLEPRKRRAAVVHAASNSVALLLFTRSWWSRARGHRWSGISSGLLGSAVATFGGYLGGWLAFGETAAAADEGAAQQAGRLAAVP